MRCATCGESLSPGDSRCPTCGAAQAPVWGSGSGGALESSNLPRCPRCGYRGDGIAYFSRPGHVGLLIGVSVFTYGLGGLAYWLARRKHRVCPNCGLGWEYSGGRRQVTGSVDSTSNVPAELPSGGTKRRVLGSALVLFASFLIMMGILEVEVAAVLVGSVVGAAGSGTFFWGWKALQERRQAVATGMQREILQLAERREGTLTVTEVSANLNLSMNAAEKLLVSMDDGFRVRSEITSEGVIVYEFPEVLHRYRLGRGGADAAPGSG